MVQQLQQETLVRLFSDEVLAAGDIKVRHVGVCDHLFLKASTGNDGDLVFSFDQQSEQGLVLGQIVATQGDPASPGGQSKFSNVTIRNKSNASITYTIIVSNGPIDYKGLVVSGSIATVPNQTANGTYADDIDGTGAAQLIFAGISNLGIILQADPANAANIPIGFDNTVSATKKVIMLGPGEKYVFESYKGDLYNNVASGNKISVSYLT